MSLAFEVNFDGLVGPTHNYAGLSFGNIASLTHRALTSNPKEAALQGLKKMKFMADAGMKQALLPPQARPDLITLRKLGFSGKDAEIIAQAAKHAPELLAACTSGSSMWTANSATVAPSADTVDGKVHFTAANLTHKLHRSIEHPTTSALLKVIFKDEKYFTHHEALPSGSAFGDEGAANHTRFCEDYGKKGVQLFVYGRTALKPSPHPEPQKFPARQTLEASQAIARLHGLDPKQVVFAQQNAKAIDAGAFHNDVVSVGNQNIFLYHEEAFLEPKVLVGELREKFKRVSQQELKAIQVSSRDVELNDAVKSYLFNSQLITLPDGNQNLIAPQECKEIASVRAYLESKLVGSKSPIQGIQYFDLRQSMQNGGGPACLRLRVVLTEAELKHTHPEVFMNESLFTKLTAWVEKYYRDQIKPHDLADPQLRVECEAALDELTQVLGLGSVYPFQTAP